MPDRHEPVVQAYPEQQGWLGPPQAMQLAWPPVPFWQAKPGEHVTDPPAIGLGQQGWLAPPHAAHVAGAGVVWQKVLGAVQRLLAQHGLPSPPHVPQVLAEQVVVIPGLHCSPALLHVAFPPLIEATQQPPSRQKLPGQQGSPLPPHPAHVEAPAKVPAWQYVLVAVQDEFVQHPSLLPPHVPHAPAEQVPASGFGQVLPLATHVPPTQHPPPVQALPAQQIWPAPPQVGAASAVSGKAELSLTSTTSTLASAGVSPRESAIPSAL